MVTKSAVILPAFNYHRNVIKLCYIKQVKLFYTETAEGFLLG